MQQKITFPDRLLAPLGDLLDRALLSLMPKDPPEENRVTFRPVSPDRQLDIAYDITTPGVPLDFRPFSELAGAGCGLALRIGGAGEDDHVTINYQIPPHIIGSLVQCGMRYRQATAHRDWPGSPLDRAAGQMARVSSGLAGVFAQDAEHFIRIQSVRDVLEILEPFNTRTEDGESDSSSRAFLLCDHYEGGLLTRLKVHFALAGEERSLQILRNLLGSHPDYGPRLAVSVVEANSSLASLLRGDLEKAARSAWVSREFRNALGKKYGVTVTEGGVRALSGEVLRKEVRRARSQERPSSPRDPE